MERTEYRPVREFLSTETENLPRENVTISIGAENTGTNTILVTIQAKQYQDNVTEKVPLRVWVSATSAGAVSAVTTMTATTGLNLFSLTAHGDFLCVTDSSGVLVISAIIAGAATRYLIVEYAGKLFISDLITWAA